MNGQRKPLTTCPPRNRPFWISYRRHPTKGFEMGEMRNKTRNAAQNAKGKAKEAAGKSVGSGKLESKDKADGRLSR